MVPTVRDLLFLVIDQQHSEHSLFNLHLTKFTEIMQYFGRTYKLEQMRAEPTKPLKMYTLHVVTVHMSKPDLMNTDLWSIAFI